LALRTIGAGTMILVTGGAGFIGSNLVAGLAGAGLGPVAVCDMFGHDAKWKNLAKHPVHEVVDPTELPLFLDQCGTAIEAVFHMGAISATTETDVDLIMRTNLTLSQSLWRFCIDADCPFIYASSAATYGDGSQGFADDNDPAALAALRPLNPYGWSKKLFDDFAIAESAAGNAPPFWAGLKFFNVYGPNEYHKEDMRSVIHKIFPDAATGKPVTLFKSHRPDFEDGGQSRDFVYVKDCAAVISWLADTPDVSGLYNLGTGEARSFKDLATATFAALNRKPNIEYVDTPEAIRDKYQYFTEAKMDRLRAAGYDKPFTSLEDGVMDYVQNYLVKDDPYL